MSSNLVHLSIHRLQVAIHVKSVEAQTHSRCFGFLGLRFNFISSQAANCILSFLQPLEYFQQSKFLPPIKNSRLHHRENPVREVLQYDRQTAHLLRRPSYLKNPITNNLTRRIKNMCKSNIKKKEISMPVLCTAELVVASFRQPVRYVQTS
ncbi:hypothetical protein TNCV_3151821 [Trichonephila clavipes]|nr:hypothetical protein TNCV_3151821 [Trichonephila clavipes]